jgi:UDPglucose 6-dehydrogenase
MIGAGYVGLVSAACFSEFGWTVTCVDKDPERLAMLEAGRSPIYEPGLDDIMTRNMRSGRLLFSADLAAAVKAADIVFLAVGTPMRRGDGYADLSYVYAAVEELAPHLDGFTVITTKSTVPVGTSREIERRLKAIRPDADYAVCSNPEFLREGSAIQDFTHPDRVLVGTDSERAREVMERLYKPLSLRHAPVIFVSRESAELAKYAANAFLALKISFINEIAAICEKLGADVEEVAVGMGMDRRIGPAFLNAGLGYGGSCFPKDVKALEHMALVQGRHPSLLRAVIDIHRDARRWAVFNLRELLGGSLDRKRIGILGLAFKPNTDDIRESPALEIARMLQHEGALVSGYDPVAMGNVARENPELRLAEDPYELADDADALLVCTEWNEFKQLDLGELKARMATPIIADGRNIYEADRMRDLGFTYRAVGRGGTFGRSSE